MYAPVPPRPKKTSIVRSRNGCKGCRERRTKCDEKKPVCGTCIRLKTACEPVKPKFEFRVSTATNQNLRSESRRLAARQQSMLVGLKEGRHPMRHIALTVSLQRSEREIFYSAYWEDKCLPALHPMLRSTSSLIAKFPPLQDAVLALSSCNLSRNDAERRTCDPVDYMGYYCPHATHQSRSQQYYSSAIQRFTKLGQSEYHYNLTTILLILVLFAHIESTRGNLEGFNCHIKGLAAILEAEIGQLNRDQFLRDLITAWMQPQFQVWWARSYFSTLDFQQQQPTIALPLTLEGSLGSTHERRIAVVSIMCESHRLNVTSILYHWQYRNGSDQLGYGSNYGSFCPDVDRCCMLLAEQSEKLDNWLLHLPLAEQPLQDDVFEIQPESSTVFQSHDAALNYAYYVLSKIMQCTGAFRLLATQDYHHLGHECYEAEPWVRLLLQIVEGIDMKKCIHQNNYTIGFSGLLLAALLRCQDLLSGRRIERWLQNLLELQPTEEGSFPVYQALAVTKAINRQRMIGKDVFAVSQPVDDGGGTPKLRSYNSQIIDTLLMHGKCRMTGDLFTDCISIDNR